MTSESTRPFQGSLLTKSLIETRYPLPHRIYWLHVMHACMYEYCYVADLINYEWYMYTAVNGVSYVINDSH